VVGTCFRTSPMLRYLCGSPVRTSTFALRRRRQGPGAQLPGFRGLVGALREISMPNLTKAVVLEGCGHWTQQERPSEVNELLLEFLAGLAD
jgi:pimeloyl-ACP methyl ester carboxylesterase